MAVTNLHEAALVLQGAHQAIAKLLAEVEPQYREACRVYARFEATHNFVREDPEEMKAAWDREITPMGHTAFSDAASNLVQLLARVDDIELEELNAVPDAS